MLIPSSFYGLYSQSKRKCKKIAAQVHKGVSLADAIGSERIDTNDHEGYFLLFGPAPKYGNVPHFHFFILLRELVMSYHPNLPSPDAMKNWFEYCVESDWGILCLISHTSLIANHNKEWQIEIAKQVRARWESIAIDSGSRYVGFQPGCHLWQMADSSLVFFLVNAGVPADEFALEKYSLFDKDSIPKLIDKYVL